MPRNAGLRGTYTQKHTMRCAWCDERFESVRAEAATCSPACRGRLKRFRDRTGFNPESPPGGDSVKQAVEGLIAELIARERARRIRSARES